MALLHRRRRFHLLAIFVERLRAARSDLAFSSDFIVGYPGESEDDFAATLDLVGEVGFADAYSFKYSSRPGTPAAGLDDQFSAELKEERLARLQTLVAAQSETFNLNCIGRTLEVLLERHGRRPGQLGGRSPYMQAVHVAAPSEMINTVQRLRIVAARMVRLSQLEAEGFYDVHRERPFFKDLVRFMTSGPVMVQVLEGEGAIAKNREVMGATDPKKAAKGTIRADLATSIDENIVHGSDAADTAAREIAFFFREIEVCPRTR